MFRRSNNPIVLSMLLVSMLAAFSASASDGDPIAELDRLFESWQPGRPGVAAGVLRNGQVIYARGFGSANLEHSVPITADTVFDIASVSKQFAGMSIAMLALRGSLSLDADIRDYLDEVPDFGHTVTPRHLLHHVSGVRDWVGLMMMSGLTMEDSLTFEQIMRMVSHQQALSFPPGDAAVYSNTGYNLLARLVEVVSGQSFPDWTRENIFAPLGMKDTYFPSNHDIVKKGRADSYMQGPDGAFRRVGNQLTALGSSSLHTTLNDLLKWLRNFETHEVGGTEALEMMREPFTLNNGEPTPYGFGLALSPWKENSEEDAKEYELLSHGGSWAGFRTWLGYFPEERIGIVVLGNYSDFDSSSTGNAMARILLGITPTAETTDAGSAQAEPAPDYRPASLDELAGHYIVEAMGVVLSIVVEEGSLVLTSPFRQVLQAEAPNVYASADGSRITFFAPDQDGSRKVRVQIMGTDLPATLLDASVPAGPAAELTGDYYSPELDTTYAIRYRDGGLFATHNRSGEFQLFPSADDAFATGAWYMSKIEFDRNPDGRVTGFRASNPRSYNVRFERR